jgi:hypothetical protein
VLQKHKKRVFVRIQQTRFLRCAHTTNAFFALSQIQETRFLRRAHTTNAFFALSQIQETRLLRCAHTTNAFIVSETQETHAARNECVDIATNAILAILAFITLATHPLTRLNCFTRFRAHLHGDGSEMQQTQVLPIMRLMLRQHA